MTEAPRIYGTLVGSRCRVELDLDDALWTARAVYGETTGGGDARDPERYAVVSCWLRRWAIVNDARIKRGDSPLWPRFRDLVLAHSQPVNPRWAEGGDLAERRGSTEAQLARRARIRGMAWNDIPERYRRPVLDLFTGRKALTGRPAVDFAAPFLWTRYGLDYSTRQKREETAPAAVQRKNPAHRYVSIPGRFDRGANVLVSTPDSRRAPEPRVVGAGPGGGVGALALAAVAVGGLLL